jgi:hypothetical protein
MRNFISLYSSLSITGTIEFMWLRHDAASRKVAGSSPDEVDFLK